MTIPDPDIDCAYKITRYEWSEAQGAGVCLVTRAHAFHPFVTWQYGPDGDCYWGSYYASASDALACYRQRREHLMPRVIA